MKNSALILCFSALALLAACNKSGDAPKPDLPPSNSPGTGGIIGSVSPNVNSRVVAVLEPNLDSITSTNSKNSDGTFVLSNLAPGKYDLKIVPLGGKYKASTFGSLIISAGGFTDAGAISLSQ